MNLEELKKLLVAMECLIDTSQRETELEGVYDDSNSQYVTWLEVYKSYRELKKAIKLLTD